MPLNRKIFLLIISMMILLLSQVNLNLNCNSNTDISDNEQLDAQTLRIVTYHDTTITTKFRTEFLTSQRAIDLNITDIQFYQSITDSGWKLLTEDPSRGIDLLWGGDPSLMEKMDSWGLIKHIDNQTLSDYINANIPDHISGIPLKHYNDTGSLGWFTTSVSTYGLLVNHDFLNQYNLSVPSTWSDLALPDYYINSSVKSIILADPTYSTMNRITYSMILQYFGWEKGWDILTRMGGNAEITYGSVDVDIAVRREFAGIGFTTDSVATTSRRENPDLEFILPENQSIIRQNPISLGINCNNPQAAEAFLQFIASPEGQATWLVKGLDRIPVNELAFQTTYGQTRTDLYNLFNKTKKVNPINFNYTLFHMNYEKIICYFHETISEEHTLLRKAWGMLVQMLNDGTINETYFEELACKLGAIPENLDIINPFDGCLELNHYAKEKYQSVIDELQETITNQTKTSYFMPIFFLFVISAITIKINKKKDKH